ncbi:MAG: hmuU 3 [Firmicutes bacterium]|nr:hmuU 3 [Bacillota bacterium]
MKLLTTKPVLLMGSSAILLVITAIYLLTIGTADISAPTVFSIITHKIFGMPNPDIPMPEQIIVWNFRWQRVALAMLVGSCLAVSGTCFQTMFKNPLADPFILGVSSGAALGAAIAIVSGHTELMIILAFIGAILSLSIVYFLGQSFLYPSDQQLLLAGVACGAMLNAMLSALMAIHSQQMQMIVFWLMGSLTNYVDSLKPLVAIVGICIIIVMVYASDLDIIALGDEDAKFLGVDVNKVKPLLLIVTSLMTGACVSVSGIIGFIGLIIPHIVRKIAGSSHIVLLPLSAIFGAIFLLAADGLTRTVPQLASLPVGVVTALFGGPFFFYILRVAGRRVS